MPGVRLILALHNHQPVGNFDDVFEAAHRESYRPFLEVMEDYPEIPFALHTSGPLLEWLVDRHPEYIDRLRKAVKQGRVEVLGGGFYEPILTMIPYRDCVGQIREYSHYLRELFGEEIRGMWLPERVWEQHLTSALVEAGVEYTILDDFHFHRAGLNQDDLVGYYLTEDDGRLLKVFPGSERLRYLIPFQEPHATYEYLRRLAERHPGAIAVFADDGEKFGSWPETQAHVYQHGWLRRFCDMIVGNSSWLEPTTFRRALDETLPVGKVYLPDSSYREMTEWALPAAQLAAYEAATKQANGNPSAERLRPFVRAGGFWRNFKVKYAESDEMYARMLGLSRRLASAGPDADPDDLAAARQELYRGQCNCPYWHGAFGGLYLPHLRNAIYHHLIAAHNALDAAEGRTGPRVSAEVADFNLDARQEVCLENDQLIAFVRPAMGGHIYELDVRHALTNVLATLDRRPEAYHNAILVASQARNGSAHAEGLASIHDRVVLKQEGLDRLLVYDRHPRKALVDHFYPLDASLRDLLACCDIERGDFVTAAYRSKVQRSPERVSLIMERPGRADGHTIHMRKSIHLEPGQPALEVYYVLDDLPPGVPLHFAIELNLAAMAGHAPDRYYSDPAGTKLGPLDTLLDLPQTEGITLTDEWLDLAVTLRWSSPAGLWCFPIETVSQSESGFEGVYQSSAIVPHWIITADETRHWELRIAWTLDRAQTETTSRPVLLARAAEAARAR
jgi:alpha-amylase/alpha-mannosidase (GH57 family)